MTPHMLHLLSVILFFLSLVFLIVSTTSSALAGYLGQFVMWLLGAAIFLQLLAMRGWAD